MHANFGPNSIDKQQKSSSMKFKFHRIFKKSMDRDFPGGPVAKTPHYQRRGPGLIPGQGTRSHMLQLKVCMPQ